MQYAHKYCAERGVAPADAAGFKKVLQQVGGMPGHGQGEWGGAMRCTYGVGGREVERKQAVRS